MAEKMAEKIEVDLEQPPAYVVNSMPFHRKPLTSFSSRSKSGCSFVNWVAVTTAILVIVVTITVNVIYFNLSLNVTQPSIKKYQLTDSDGPAPVTEDIEIDTANNVVVFRLSGAGMEPGTFAVLDHTKAMTGLYIPETKTCYLLGGIFKDFADAEALSRNLDKNVTRPGHMLTMRYHMAHSYPVSDKSFLPAPMKTVCAHIPVYWLEKKTQQKSLQKRDADCVLIERCVWTLEFDADGEYLGSYRECFYIVAC